jgi:hypothetical protein
MDRLLLVGLYRLAPGTLDALKIIRPATLLRWHRGRFRAYWRWKSRPRGGQPATPADIRRLIREMSIANPLWGAPRIHGELLKFGIDVGPDYGTRSRSFGTMVATVHHGDMHEIQRAPINGPCKDT